MPPPNRCPDCGSPVDDRDALGGGRLRCPECGTTFHATGSRAVGSNTGLILLLVLGGGGLVIVLGFVAVLGFWFIGAAGPKPAAPAPVARGPADPEPANGLALQPANPIVPGLAKDGRKTYDPVHSVALPKGKRTMNLVLAPNAAGPIGLIREPTEVGIGHLSLFDAKSGAPVAELTLKKWGLGAVAVSPDAKWVAHMEMVNETVILTPVADPAAARSFSPRPKDGADAVGSRFLWFTFVAADRLFTLYQDGRFDVWSVPGFERVAVRTEIAKGWAGLKFDGAGQYLERFAITSDRTACVIRAGKEFIVCDPRTGAEKTRFSPLDEDTARQMDALALSADGGKLAGLTADRLIVIDTKTGRVRSNVPVKTFALALSWWGPNHVLGHNGLMTHADIFEAETGTKVGRLQTWAIKETFFTPFGPDDRAWCVNTPPDAPGRFYAFDAPADLKGAKGVQYSVGEKGMTRSAGGE